MCVCVCPCDPLETKFARSYHFPHRTAHLGADAEDQQNQGRRRRKDVPFHRGGGEGGNMFRYA